METSPPFGSVSGPPWDEVFLVGGGPSLRGFDFGRLEGRTVVAINDALLHLPRAVALFSADRPWIERRRCEIERFVGEKYLAVANDHPRDVAGAVWLHRDRGRGLSDRLDTVIIGGNSGYGALNLAYLKGAWRVVLLGYDFCTVDGQRRWYGGFQQDMHWDVYMRWATEFEYALPQLKAKGVEVLNASPISQIMAFPKIDLERLGGI